MLEFINNLPNESVPLLEWVIKSRIAKSDAFVDKSGNFISEPLTKYFFTYLYISQSGLSENELTEILGEDDVLGNVPALLRQIRNFLSYRENLKKLHLHYLLNIVLKC